MDMFKSLIVILLSSVLVNNYVLSRFLGIWEAVSVAFLTKLGGCLLLTCSVLNNETNKKKK